MNKGEIVNKVYEDVIEQATRVLFQELMIDDHSGRHAGAERRFGLGLKAATLARDRAKILIEVDQ